MGRHSLNLQTANVNEMEKATRKPRATKPNHPAAKAKQAATKAKPATRKDLDTKAEKTDRRKTQMLEALRKTMGVVTKAAEMVGISRMQHYNWCEQDPAYKEATDDIIERKIDFVESKLFELINGVKVITKIDGKEQSVYTTPPDKTSIIFFLKTVGKKRGYNERVEITGADGGALLPEDNRTFVIELPPPRK